MHEFPVFAILTMILGINSHIKPDLDINGYIEGEAIDIHEEILSKRKMSQFIQQGYSILCDDLRTEDGDGGGFVDHCSGRRVDVAVIDVSGLLLFHQI